MSDTKTEDEVIDEADKAIAERRKVINKPVRRHIYAVIIDCEERDDEMAALISRTANEAFTNPDGKQRQINLAVVVPATDEDGRRLPKVMLR
jgi:hypothetical protein